MAANLKTKRERSIKSVSDLFESLFTSCNIQQEISLEKIRESWKDIAGAVLSVHTSPISLENGVLKVLADHSVYANDLQMAKYTILQKINAQFGSVINALAVTQIKNRFRK